MREHEEPKSELTGCSPEKQKESKVKLPPEYWAELLELPRCKIDGSCDNCGRCEH